MAITQSGRNDASHDVAGFGPIRVDDGQRQALGNSNGDHAAFSLVPAGVLTFQGGALEDQRGKLEIESTVSEVPGALLLVPAETHRYSIRLYIQTGQQAAA
jgi:hypothetical protein